MSTKRKSDTISRRDAIDALERKKDKNAKGDIGGFYNKIIQNDIDTLMQLPSAQPAQRWIPCSERLPKKNVWVLVTFMMANGEVDIDIMRINRWDGGWDTHTFDMAYRETVIAWMPMPEPWREENR